MLETSHVPVVEEPGLKTPGSAIRSPKIQPQQTILVSPDCTS
jgi:hypothetical protein